MNKKAAYESIAILVLTATLPGVAAAQDSGKYQCSHGDMQRRVEIVTEPGAEVPCSVHYYKDTEMPGEQQVLWTAENDASYCERKAQELVSKLAGWGWDCSQSETNGTGDDAVEELLGEPDVTEMTDESE